MKLPAFALCLLPLSGGAQQLLLDAASPQMVIKGSDIVARIAKSAVPDPKGSQRGIELLLQQGVYRVNLEYHPGPSGVGLNEDVAELMVVLEGSGAILLGGTPVDPVRSGFHLQASKAQGSTSYAVEKGDAILIPQGVAHAIGPVKNRLILMSMHVPPATVGLPGDNPLPDFDKMLAMPREPPPGAPPQQEPPRYRRAFRSISRSRARGPPSRRAWRRAIASASPSRTRPASCAQVSARMACPTAASIWRFART